MLPHLTDLAPAVMSVVVVRGDVHLTSCLCFHLLASLTACFSVTPHALSDCLRTCLCVLPEEEQDIRHPRDRDVGGQQDERGREKEKEKEAVKNDEWAPSKSEMEHLAVRLMALECLVSECASE